MTHFEIAGALMNFLLNAWYGPFDLRSSFDPNGYRLGVIEFMGIMRIVQIALREVGYYNSAIYGLFGDGPLGAMEKLMLENR